MVLIIDDGMSYSMKFTNISSVCAILQIDITSSTKPSTAQVTQWAQEVEDGMMERNLSISSTDALTKFDVLPTNTYDRGTVAWVYAGLPSDSDGKIIVPPFVPIVEVLSGTLSRNKSTLSETADWEILTEGPGDDSDYVILRRRTRNNKYYGYAIYFYGDVPYSGRDRVRGTWTFGYNVDAQILQEYATLKVCEKVILARLMSGQPGNVATYTAGNDLNSYVNTQFETQLQYIKDRITELEKNHFPRQQIPVALL